MVRDAPDDCSIAHDMPMHMAVKHVHGRTEDIGGGRDDPERDCDAAGPVICRGHRGPADIAVVTCAPHNPRRCIDAPGNPCPSAPRDPDPPAVVEGDVAPVVVAHPKPIAFFRQRPASCCLVRGEIGTDDGAARNPHRAVCRIDDPRSIRRERFVEIAERAGVGVGKLVGRDAGLNGDFYIGLCSRRGRRRYGIGVVRIHGRGGVACGDKERKQNPASRCTPSPGGFPSWGRLPWGGAGEG